ncbi:zinc ribbon domain-containing protein [Mycolicibacterium sp. CH28]|uniref:zinc ribbon domain-containing protein n=1 Tax=Mycolicibacterium sp. CH28 TaxID=2512237 RepID=UPI00107FD91B|nr:zinc ribbon domain-containing protein [Mycolicibacterium sp. CH28]TGD84096.1 zinc ribbon domain-containing protein [Mycolicibacterium sp. CH28]
MTCPACAAEVPAGVFCGVCGAHLAPQAGDGPQWLRPRVFCAAPAEHVLRPAISSSLFPHLSQLARTPFVYGLILLIAAMALSIEIKLPGALVTVAALGLPLLLVIYQQQTGVYRDIPRSSLLLTAGLGIAIGVGWVLLTGDLVIRETGAPFDVGIAGNRVLRDGLGVAEGGALLMMIPAVAVRLLRPGQRESLNGLVIGMLSAISFTAAATFTRLAPQFAAATVSKDRPVEWLLVESAIRGVTIPLTAACAGGLVGAALWFRRADDGKPRRRTLVVGALTLFGVVVLAIYAVVGITDVAGLPQAKMLAWHVAMALVALIALRIGVQLALLHEQPGEMRGEPQLCLHCRTVVPEMAFCPLCGAAAHASPNSSRAQRRNVVVHLDTDDATGTGSQWPGYAGATATYTCEPLPRTPNVRVPVVWAVVIAVIAAPLIGLSASIAEPAVLYNCPPDCGRPPSGTPVASLPRFTAPGGEFSVSYPAAGSSYDITFDTNGVRALYTGGDGGTLKLWGQPADGRSAQEIATTFLAERYPNKRTAYQIPNAMVGYQHGYGEVADIWPQDGDASYQHLRLVILVAVKNDYALLAGAIGPYRQFGPNFGPGRPSGANLELAIDLDKYVNSFAWRGDPPR